MKLIYLIIGLAIALSHSPILAERSVPAIMIGVAGLGGFGYKGLSTYEKIRLLDRGIKILEMLVNGQVNGESAEELIALKSNLQSAKKRLMLYVVGGLVSALILAKGAVKGQRESAISSQVEGHDSDLVPSLQNLEKPELVSPVAGCPRNEHRDAITSSGTAISSTPSSSISTKDGELRVETASNLMPLPIQTSSDLEQNEEAEARRLLEQIDSADLNTAQRAADEYGLLDGYIISLERENICKSLSRAIQNKDYERAKIFYSLGARLDEKENYLAAIAITNSDDIISVKKLLNNFSVNINAWDGNGYSLLVRVIRDGLAKQAMMIIRVQRDEKTSSYDERVFLTALSSYALGKVDIPLIQEILVDGVDYNEKVQKFGRRAIFAAYKKSLEEGKTLEDLLATKLSLKIDKSTMTDKEVNLLGIGRMYDLLKSGENLSDAILSSIAANLFHHSISEDDFNTAKTVLPYIKNINEVGSECAHPPLIEVIRSSYFLGLANAIDLVKMILARNEVQVNEFGDGTSALLEAVGVSVQSEDGTEYFDTTILELLLARSDIDIDGLRYPLGYNRPLTKACLFGNAKAVELLFDHRASLLVCLLGENRPLLHVAVAANPPYQKSYTDVLAIVKTLLDHGLEKSVKDLTGRTAYDVATERLEFFNCEAQKAGTSNAQELLDILKPE